MKLLITGANRGLGLALVAEAVRRGHTVFAGVRDPNGLVGGLADLQALFPQNLKVIELDVISEESCMKVAEQVKHEAGELNVIINNAGVLTERDKKIEDIDLEQVHYTFNVNVYGPIRVIKHFLPLLVKRSESSIINISSEAGSYQNAYGGDYPYALSKHTLNMFSKQLHHYLSGHEVRVFAIHPGWIQTDMGGDQAPGRPEETANGILEIVEGKKEIKEQTNFINFKGEPMPF